MWLMYLTVIRAPEIRARSLSSSVPQTVSKSSLPPLPNQQRSHQSFTSVKSHHIPPKVTYRECTVTHLAAESREAQRICHEESLSTSLPMALTLNFSSTDLSGISSPHHPAHRSVPGTQ